MPGAILADFSARNTTAQLTNAKMSWGHTFMARDLTSSSPRFTLHHQELTGPGEFGFSLVLRVPTHQPIVYYPSASELLKFAWIQYLAMFIIVYKLVMTAKDFIFRNQVLETRVILDHASSAPRQKIHRF